MVSDDSCPNLPAELRAVHPSATSAPSEELPGHPWKKSRLLTPCSQPSHLFPRESEHSRVTCSQTEHQAGC